MGEEEQGSQHCPTCGAGAETIHACRCPAETIAIGWEPPYDEGNSAPDDRSFEARALTAEAEVERLKGALIVIRNRFFPADQPERDRDLDWDVVNDALSPPDQEPTP